MQKLKMEIKFFTSLERRLIGCLFVWKWFIAEIYKMVKTNYHTEIRLCTIVRRRKLGTSAAAQNGTSVLYIIVEKLISCLFVCKWFHCRDIENRFSHRDEDMYVPSLEDTLGTIIENRLSHRDNDMYVPSLEDTHLGPLQQLKMKLKFFTPL